MSSTVVAPPIERRLLTADQAGEYLGISAGTLKKWRSALTGPAYVRIGTSGIRYDVMELDKWIAERTIHPQYGS